MITRCENPSHRFWSLYGGAGIVVCDRWHSFELFLEDMGERPGKEFSLDRHPDRNGNYEPGNVRWATQAQQIQNSANAKLTAEQVKAIREGFANGESAPRSRSVLALVAHTLQVSSPGDSGRTSTRARTHACGLYSGSRSWGRSRWCSARRTRACSSWCPR